MLSARSASKSAGNSSRARVDLTRTTTLGLRAIRSDPRALAAVTSARVTRARLVNTSILPDKVRESPIRPHHAISIHRVCLSSGRSVPWRRSRICPPWGASARGFFSSGPSTTARRDSIVWEHGHASGVRNTRRGMLAVVDGPTRTGTSSEPNASHSRRDLVP